MKDLETKERMKTLRKGFRQITDWMEPGGMLDSQHGRITNLVWLQRERDRMNGAGANCRVYRLGNLLCLAPDGSMKNSDATVVE